MSLAQDPEYPAANENGTRLEAVTKDHLNTLISGQIRFRVSEQNLYGYLFATRNPIAHVMGYFVSILRQRIASFAAPAKPTATAPNALPAGQGAFRTLEAGPTPNALAVATDGEQPLALTDADIQTVPSRGEALGAQGVSINDLRKNLRDLNDAMEANCASSAARYGVALDACLITGIDPPNEVDSALAAINTAYNHVSSEISLAEASADQRIVQSRRAVEIETLRVQTEVEPLRALSAELEVLDRQNPGSLDAYVKNLRLSLLGKAKRAIVPLSTTSGSTEPPAADTRTLGRKF
jgi:hypothetical protein